MNHVWAYDFVEKWTRDGRQYRMLCLPDELAPECLANKVARRLNSTDVIEMLAALCLECSSWTSLRGADQQRGGLLTSLIRRTLATLGL